MEKNLRQPLFELLYNHRDGTKRVLFASLKDLATEVCNLKIGYDNPVTLSSFLSQILRPIEEDPRSMPPKLFEAILKIAAETLTEKSAEDFNSHFLDSYNDFNEIRKNKTTSSAWESFNNNAWDRFRNVMGIRPNEIYMFLPDTSFFEWDTILDLKKNFTTMIVSNLLLRNPMDPNLNSARNLFKRFGSSDDLKIFFPDAASILSFWKLIRQHLIEKEKWNDKEIEILINTKYISTFQVSAEKCVLPLILFKGLKSKVHLFSFSYDDGNSKVLTLMEYNEKISNEWYKSNLLPILMEPNDFKLKKFEYQNMPDLL